MDKSEDGEIEGKLASRDQPREPTELRMVRTTFGNLHWVTDYFQFLHCHEQAAIV